MKFSSLFINRPVLGIVTNIVITIFGIASFNMLGVRDYPAVDPPIINVQTTYGGASAEVVEAKITEPLEESVNGISGIRSLTSSSATGRSRLTVEFNLGTDLEAAANDVRDRVSRAMRNLPPDVDNPVVAKADADASPIIFMTVQSNKRTSIELSQIANDVIKERLQTINFVSSVNIWGEKKLAIRFWLDPTQMRAHGVTVQDVKTALDKENVELPSGQIEGLSTELTVRTMSGLSSLDDFKKLIVIENNGDLVRMRDIAEVVEGAEDEKTIMKRDGVPMLGIVILPQAGANTIAIADEFYKRLKHLKKDLPSDVKTDIAFDTTVNIRKSISEVMETIFIAFILVVFVIFGFLRNWRATLIPVLAIPVSLIGTFFIMAICGFSINILTLLGIVLATGLVVDDAIVVLENIFNKIEQGHTPLDAGHLGASEIFFAIISTTAAIFSVMMPVIFMQGTTGRLFREFGAVVAGSVILSAFVSLSITPMLCTRLLHKHDNHEHSFYARTEPFFIWIVNGYRDSLISFMRHRRIAFLIFGLATVMIVAIYMVLPRELAPMEDRSRINISSTAQEGASFEYTVAYSDKIANLIDKIVPEKESMIQRIPGGYGSGGVNSTAFRMTLKEPALRKRTQNQIALSIMKQCRSLTGVRTMVSQEPTIGDRRGGQPVQYIIQAPNMEKLREIIPKFLLEVSQNPTFLGNDVDLKFNRPELQITIDREKARDLGVSASDVAQALSLSLSGQKYGYFVRNGKQYTVIGQFSRENRDKPIDLMTISVRNKYGKFIQLSNLISIKETSNPPQIFHYNRYVSATISAGLAPEKTIGDGIAEMDRIKKKVLDHSFSTDLGGISRDFAESSSNVVYSFLFALVLIYLVLSAQFESFRHPFTVMLTVPLALAGALFSLWYFHQTLNIFSQIGIIMLIGLVTKNGILIVEFANQRRHSGMKLFDAVISASVSRFRPIIMTSLTVMLGSLPIALALGAGAESRISMGIVIIGGLLFSLVLSLYVIPVMYTYLSESDKKFDEKQKLLQQTATVNQTAKAG
ncbi:MAG TPA: efflux RND transporter permease subunit [Chitinispirillaceae bacterium]|nr:efflux RND transporter permease subunit [Chitinispirillaceae bacterium]